MESNTFLYLWISNKRVTSCKLRVRSYESLFIGRVTSWFLHTSYRLYLLQQLKVNYYIRVTSYYLHHVSRVNFYVGVTIQYLLHELRVTFHIESPISDH